MVLNSPFLGAEPKPGGVRVRVGGTDPATITVKVSDELWAETTALCAWASGQSCRQ